MEDRPTYSYIPKNLNNTGGLFGGAVDTRRLIEGLIGAGIAFIIYKIGSEYIHGTTFLYICAILGLILFAAGMYGGNGEPLSAFLLNFISYENRRIFVTLRPPMPDFGPDETVEKGSAAGRILMRRFGKGEEDKA